MPATRSIRRKRQTRLSFEPLGSSDPVSQRYSDAVQDHSVSGRFQGSHRPVNQPPDLEERVQMGVPSASFDSTSQLSDEPSVPGHGRRSPIRPGATSSSPAEQAPNVKDDDDDDVVVPFSKRKRIEGLDQSVNEASSELRRRSTRATLQSSPLARLGVSHTDLDRSSTPSRRSKRLRDKPAFGLSSSPYSTSKHAESKLSAMDDLASAESSKSDDEVMVTKPSRRKTSTKAGNDDPFIVPDDDDEVEVNISGEKVKPARVAIKRWDDPNDFIADDDEVEYITSSDEGRGKRGRPKKHPRRTKTTRQRSCQEQQELEDDLLDLQTSERESSPEKSRTRGGPVTTHRDKMRGHLEVLKMRRARGGAPRRIPSDQESLESNSTDSEGIDIEKITSHLDRVDDDSDRRRLSKFSMLGAPETEPELYNFEDDVDDFIVEDSHDQPTGRLGRPSSAMPLHFTSFASAKPKELFPHIIEWMVKNKLSPAFRRADDVYNLSFSRVDDQVKAQAGSRLISAAWNAKFKYTVLARPDMKVEALPGLDEDLIRTCDACNKANRPARYEFTFTGQPYSLDTLEPVDSSDSSNNEEADDADDVVSHDEQGHILAPQTTRFFLGRYCAANAEMGHKLTHWKHRLNREVLDYLEEQGVLAADAIIAREKLSKKKREREAESIVDAMQDTGMIAELWQHFQDDLEDARIGMEGYAPKSGRSSHRIGNIRYTRDDGTTGEWMEGGRHKTVAQRFESDSEGE